ncbi:hypothetical protein CRU79_15215 [Escherichia sp. E4385]|uniref:hypothetical protein n=1 Tax=Escherichia sp. E4385 TaxID=2040639 RepID=UPI00107F549E|nr:hypothetical protein [Escherichia sp. E4385]TGC14791.1 hypothetical protein CRU79_15215 [Escherichia sp. E4385]
MVVPAPELLIELELLIQQELEPGLSCWHCFFLGLAVVVLDIVDMLFLLGKFDKRRNIPVGSFPAGVSDIKVTLTVCG